MTTTRRGRNAHTGRYETREELERMVHTFYAVPGRTMLDVARICRVSHGVVSSILKKPAPKPPTDDKAVMRAALARTEGIDGSRVLNLSIAEYAALCRLTAP